MTPGAGGAAAARVHRKTDLAAAAGGKPTSRPIRVMIVDDSLVARAVLCRIVEADRDFEVVAQASNADAALDVLQGVRVDIVMLDVEMPGTCGLTALPRILANARGARVIIVSSIAEDGAAAAVQALSLGAADTISKPGSGRTHGNFAQVLLSKMRTIGHARREDLRVAPPMADPRMAGIRLRPMSAHPIRCIAIGASTGGLHALSQLFMALPPLVGVPILVTQHLPPVFIPFFASQLAGLTGRTVDVAADGGALTADRVLIAPGDGHLRIRGGAGEMRVFIDRTGPSGGCLPSVDPMFLSVCERFGAAACAVVLTGMGRDGLVGAEALAAAGASVLVQDPASSAVWGMPRSVAEAGHACAVLDPASIARRIASRTGAAPTHSASTWR